MTKKILDGKVIKDKNDKTIVVLVKRRYSHPFFHKVITSSKKYHVHDKDNKHKIGDNYKTVFEDLKKSIDNQEVFGSKIKKYLDDYGLYEQNHNTKSIKVCIPGCGKGDDALYFSRCGYDVYAFDFSKYAPVVTNHLLGSKLISLYPLF